MDPTDDQLWSNYYIITKPTSRLWTGSSHDFVVINFMAHIRCISRGFRFLKSFGGGRDVQKGHFRFVFSFTKYNMAAKQFYLSKKGVLFWPDNFSTERWKSVKGWPRSFGAFWCEYKYGDARHTTLPSGNVSRLVSTSFAHVQLRAG